MQHMADLMKKGGFSQIAAQTLSNIKILVIVLPNKQAPAPKKLPRDNFKHKEDQPRCLD
jgi:hypothetical protein